MTGAGAAGAGGVSEPGGAAAGGADAGLPPGISGSSKTVACGAEMCESAGVPKASLFIDPCCTAGACGLDTAFLGLVGATFTDKCQAKGQVGEVDETCPTTAPSMTGKCCTSLPSWRPSSPNRVLAL